MNEQVKVSIDTEVEVFPVLGIRPSESEHGYEIPAAMLDALKAAHETVTLIEAVIMEHVGQAYPDARDVTEWLADRANDAKFEAARDAYESAHPEGPDWMHLEASERFRLLAEAGWTNRHLG